MLNEQKKQDWLMQLEAEAQTEAARESARYAKEAARQAKRQADQANEGGNFLTMCLNCANLNGCGMSIHPPKYCGAFKSRK
jgi:hypothetical protein